MRTIATGLIAAGLIAATATSAMAASETVRKPTAAEDATLVPTLRAGIPASWQAKVSFKTRISTVNSSYAGYSFGPRPGYNDGSIQGGYGFAKKTGKKWKIVDFGTSGVGCKNVPWPVIKDLLPSILGFVEKC
ncbi:MAG: hypothetical protein ACKOGE_01455 [Actinomycetota bacterium]